TYTEERWKKDGQFFEERAAQLGATVIRQVCNGNEQLQNEQVENLITQGVDVLVIVPHNSKTAAKAVNSAKEAGIKVIAYDRMIKDCDLDLYVSFDNEQVGVLQAQTLVGLAPKGNYMLVEGSATDENAFLYNKGHMQILKPLIDSGHITIVMEQYCKDWLPIEAYKQTQNALTKNNNNIAAILVANDGLAGGCIQALTEQQLAGKIPVSGQDAELAAVQRVIDGVQSMTVYKPIKQLAYAGAEAAIALAENKPTAATTRTINNGKKEVSALLLAPVAVDKNNVKQTVIADGYIKATELKMQ
ncbi:MAG TPA: substrate-binding domain-containing protein, partial [Bacteroidia bacterium]|nr:substrate-binding domain-containing protein [Bacteroidia bacterium]